MSSLDRRIAELERKIEEKEKKKDEFSFGSNEWNLLNDEWKVLNDKWKLLQEEKLKSLAPPPNFTDKELIKNALKEYEEDKEAQIIALSKMSEKQMKFLLASLGKLRRLPSEFIVPTIDIETFEKFTWKTQNEDVDMNDARVHLISQMKKYGVELETTAGAFHLYDVHNDHHIYDLEDPKLGKISGGTDFIIAPKNLLGQSVIYNHCLLLELKTTKRMKKEDEYKRLVNQTLGELIVASYWSDQKVIAILSDLNEFVHTFQLDYEQDQLVIREISPFPVEYIGFFIKEHLNSSIADNLYKLPAAPSNDMEKVIVEFKKIAVTDPLHSEAYSQFMDLLDLTPKYSYERNLVIRDYLGMSIDIEGIPESKLNSSDNWKNLYT